MFNLHLWAFDLHTRLLAKIEQKSDATPEQLVDECEHLINLNHDAARIQKQERSGHIVNTQNSQAIHINSEAVRTSAVQVAQTALAVQVLWIPALSEYSDPNNVVV